MYKHILIYCNESMRQTENDPLQYGIRELWETQWPSVTQDLDTLIQFINNNENVYCTRSLTSQQVNELLIVIGRRNKLNKLNSLK